MRVFSSMSNEKKSDAPRFDMEIKLPLIVPGPVKSSNGTSFSVGDTIHHPVHGKGQLIRIADYEDVGLCFYIEFENGDNEIIGIDFVSKA